MLTFKKINLDHTYYFFNDIKNSDLDLVSITKNVLKILMLLFMKSNIS